MLRECTAPAELKQQGAYFTGPRLAQRLANAAVTGREEPRLFFDPACGAGDLLLAIARRLPLESTFASTVEKWGGRLAGCDVSNDFVRLTKTRLVLLAAKRCRIRPPLDPAILTDTFPCIVVADSLNRLERPPDSDVVIMNPPFGYTTAPANCPWATGRINLAALFIDHAIRNVRAETRIVAILPDVLRSGSRYAAWRRATKAAGQLISETPLGRFDVWADVDVYLFHFCKTVRNGPLAQQLAIATPTYGVGKRFWVHVGSVVPHRHPETGPRIGYIHARALPPWGECAQVTETRRFDGRLFDPPFVAVRRTSRPDAGKRAIATLILGQDPVAVENHLIVVLPKDRRVDTCRKLIERLRSPKTDSWLDVRLRCRHLTTRALSEMPWWYKP